MFKEHLDGRKIHISVVPLGISTTLTSLGLDYFQTYFPFYCLEESPENKSCFALFITSSKRMS